MCTHTHTEEEEEVEEEEGDEDEEEEEEGEEDAYQQMMCACGAGGDGIAWLRLPTLAVRKVGWRGECGRSETFPRSLHRPSPQPIFPDAWSWPRPRFAERRCGTPTYTKYGTWRACALGLLCYDLLCYAIYNTHMFIYIYIYISIYASTYIYIYIYRGLLEVCRRLS